MELIGVLILLTLVGLPVAGGICGVIALRRLKRAEDRVMELAAKLDAREFRAQFVAAPEPPRPAARPAPPAPPPPAPLRPVEPVPAPLRPVEPVSTPPPVKAPTHIVTKPTPPPPVAVREPEPSLRYPTPIVISVPPPVPAFAATAEAAAAAARRGSSQDWEAILGGNWFAKLGALAVVIGIALLLQYSFTHMGPAGIVSISLAGSAAMLGAGVVVEPRERYRIFARALISGGWAGLYVTVYSMHVVSAAKVIDNPYLAGVLLIAVAAGMIVHSLKYRSEIVAGLAYFIAFFTLVITQITSLSLISLIPLAASILFIAHHFRWSRMALGGLVATYLTVALRPDTGAPLWETQAIFTAYWLLFEVFDILQADSWLLPLNAVGFLGLSLMKWQRADPEHIWRLLAAVAAAYLVSAVLRARRGRWQGAVALAAGLAAAAIFQRLDHQWVASALVVEAELFYLSGIRLRSSYLRWLGTSLFAVEACRLLADVGNLPVNAWAPVAALDAVVFYANRFLCAADLFYGYAGAVAVALVAGFKAPDRYRGFGWLASAVVPFAFGWWRRLADIRLQGYLLWGLGLIGVEMALDPLPLSSAAAVSYGLALCALWSKDDRMGPEERGALRLLGSLAATAALAALASDVVGDRYLGIAWIAVGVVLMELGIFGWPAEIRRFAMGLAAVSAGWMLINDIVPLGNHGPWIPRLLPAGASLLAYWIAWRSRETDGPVRIVAAWTATGFLAVSMWAALPPDAVAACWAFYALALLAAGLRWKKPQISGLSCALAIVAYSWWAVNLLLLPAGAGLSASTLAGCAGTIACYYAAQLLSPRGHVIRLYTSLLATTLTSLLLYQHVSGRMLTIAWGIQGVALLAAGFPLRDRIPRLSGLVILLACILKLFVYDLGYLETLPRILSFLVLGLILVGVSWVYSRFRERFTGEI